MAWTKDRVEILKRLWADKSLSARQIAGRLGGVTRNAVIGKVHRLGLPGRAPSSRRTRRASRGSAGPQAAAQQRPETRLGIVETGAVPVGAPQEAARLPNGEYATVLVLREGMCKWPIGDPTDAEFRFCGRHAGTGNTYCEAHAQIAYQPQIRRKRKPSDAAMAILDNLRSSRRVNV